jgi:acyl-CoA oxidase
VTWEGDNSVLIQQTARFILKNLQRLLKGQPIEAKTLYFLKFNSETAKKEQGEFKAKQELRDNPEMLRRMLLHRASALLDSSMIKLQENVAGFADVGEAWSHTQVHYLRELSKAYGELYLADTFMNRLATVKSTCADTHAILLRIYELYVLNIIERDLGTFREGNYLSSDQGKMVKEYVRDLTWEIGESAVKIIDAIALPDFIVGSVLGHSDGQVYRHLIEAVETAADVYNLPSWLPLVQQLRKQDS